MTTIINRVKALGEALQAFNPVVSKNERVASLRFKALNDFPVLLLDLEKLLAPPSEEEIEVAAEAIVQMEDQEQSNPINFLHAYAKAAITTFLKGRGI